jgi:shikimate dehydrogenase
MQAVESAEAAVVVAAGVVNCTAVGMFGHPGTPFAPALLRPHQWLMDCVYTPAETELVRSARASGLTCVTGDRTDDGGAVIPQHAAPSVFPYRI